MGIIDEIKNSKYMSLIPNRYLENEDFLVFIYLLIHQWNVNEENIRKFIDLVNNDKVPMKFLQNLGSYVNYTYQPLAKNDFNRELSMRMFNIWEQRGTKKAIIDAATYGDNKGWVGGDLFIPEYWKPGQVAGFELPRDRIFRHSISKFSSTHVFQDGKTYLPGVILLSVPNLTKEIKRRVYEVTPAGRKYLFQLESEFYPNEDIDPLEIGDFRELSFYKWMRIWPKGKLEEIPPYDRNTDIDMWIIIDMLVQMDEAFDILIHSRNDEGRKLHSGRIVNLTDYGLEVNMLASSLPIANLKIPFNTKNGYPLADWYYKKSQSGEYLDWKYDKRPDGLFHDLNSEVNIIDDIEVNKEVRLTAIRSENSANRSGNGKMSGITTSVIDNFVEEANILPSDCLYSVDTVADLREWDYRDEFETSPFERGYTDSMPWTVELGRVNYKSVS